jgi:hypothetical protein
MDGRKDGLDGMETTEFELLKYFNSNCKSRNCILEKFIVWL